MISVLAEDMDLYSASTKDLKTVVCILYFQDIGEVPRSIHQPL